MSNFGFDTYCHKETEYTAPDFPVRITLSVIMLLLVASIHGRMARFARAVSVLCTQFYSYSF